LELADRIAIMNVGHIEQVASPAEAYDHPATPFVSEFLGFANRLPCRVERGFAKVGDMMLPTELDGYVGEAVAFIRPHEIGLSRLNGHDVGRATIDAIVSLGPDARVDLAYEGHRLEAMVDRERLAELGLVAGEICSISIARAHVFRAA
jgi:sulfate transport system ATP-binding protein